MTQIAQPYNLFAQQKRASYPSAQVQQQLNVPGNVQGETVQEFASGKQSANTQSQGVGETIQTAPQSTNEKSAVVQMPVPKSRGAVSSGVQSNPAITNMDELAAALGYTSPQEEERLRKASVANQRIMAVADALRHIGNIAHTVNYAPSQQFNSPVAEESARYLQGKALRDKANQTYLTYQQQKAAQDLKMQQLNDATDLKLKQLAFNQDKFNRQQNLNEFKAKNDEWYKKATVEQKEQALDIQRQLAEGRISLMDAQRALAEVKTKQGGFSPKSGGRGGSGTEWTRTSETKINRDEEGRETGRTTTIRRSNSKTGENSSTTKSRTTQPQKKALPGQAPAQPKKSAKKRLPGM